MTTRKSSCASHSGNLLILLWLFALVPLSHAAEAGWKAGTAATIITPTKPMWMAGYGGRDRPAEGKLQDLWVKALVLEDAAGLRAVVLSSDTLGIPQSIYEHSVKAVKERFNLDRSQIMLNASHTHCGPVLRQALYDVYPMDAQQVALVEEYSRNL